MNTPAVSIPLQVQSRASMRNDTDTCRTQVVVIHMHQTANRQCVKKGCHVGEMHGILWAISLRKGTFVTLLF